MRTVPDWISRRVRVSGHVQGVFFRDATRREAQLEGVAGWVANQPDGSVEAVFEGAPDAVARMVDFCRVGPERARVDELEELPEPPEGLSGFEVR